MSTPADAVVAAGAAVVLSLLAAAFLVVEPGNGPSVRGIVLQPDEARAEPQADAFAAPAVPLGATDPAAPLAQPPAYTRVTGVARVSAFGPAGGGTRPQPVCDYEWAPQVRLDDGAPAVVSVPGVLSGLVVANDRATWNCDYTYRADIRGDESAASPRFDQ